MRLQEELDLQKTQKLKNFLLRLLGLKIVMKIVYHTTKGTGEKFYYTKNKGWSRNIQKAKWFHGKPDIGYTNRKVEIKSFYLDNKRNPKFTLLYRLLLITLFTVYLIVFVDKFILK